MAGDLAVAVALVLIIEGAGYALFPAAMKRMILQVAELPAPTLRNWGLAAAMIGVGVLWLVRR